MSKLDFSKKISSEEVLKILEDCEKQSDIENVFRYVCRYELTDTFDKLRKRGIKFSMDKHYQFKQSALLGKFEMFKLLLTDDTVNMYVEDNYCILYASENNHWDIVEYIMNSEGFDPSINNNSLIQRLCKSNRNARLIKILLEDERVDPSVDNLALINTIQFNNKEIFDILIKDKRINPSAHCSGSRCEYETTALAVSCVHNRYDMFKVLLEECKVDPSDMDNFAIQKASAFGNIEMVRDLLKDERVDPTVNNNYCINHAFNFNHIDIARLLLEREGVFIEDMEYVKREFNYAIEHDVPEKVIFCIDIGHPKPDITVEPYKNLSNELKERIVHA